MKVYLARHLLSVVRPALADAAVAVENGEIVAAGPRGDVLAAVGESGEVQDLGNVVVLPGLVNAHTHLELSWMGDDPPAGGSYVGWLRELLEMRSRVREETALAAAESAIHDVVRRGTVAVGDVSNDAWILPLLARSGLHGIAFHEILGLDAGKSEEELHEAAGKLDELELDPDLRDARDRLHIALTPHAPHTVGTALLRAMAGRSAATGDPMSVHVAESAEECRLLADGSGPLGELFDERGFRDEHWEPPQHTPVEHLERLGALGPRTLAIHCVHLTHEDHSRLQSSGATVVACPRSNERLGVGIAPIFKLMGEGIPVALGTDSLASVPDLDLFAEIVALRAQQPSLRPAAIIRMVTLNGARALGVEKRLGSVEPGKLARLLVVPLDTDGDDPLETVCSAPPVVHWLEDAPATAVS